MNTGEEIEVKNTILVDPRHIELPTDNPNHMSPEKMNALRSFIQKRGFLVPVVIHRQEGANPYKIVDGDHRTRIAVGLKMPKVPAVIVSATDAERIRDRIAINNLHGDPDLTAVARDLEILIKEFDDPAELAVTGYTPDDVSAMLDAVRTQTDLEQLRDEGVQPPPDEPEPGEKTFVMAVKFESELDRARVREAALEVSPDGSLAAGLVAMSKGTE